jgi:NADH-quinone oxidoreductase subunit C
MLIKDLHYKINTIFLTKIEQSFIDCDELTIEVSPQHLHEICLALRDEPDFDFKLLIDVCGVDYLQYGKSQWETESATETGFSRGVEAISFLPTEFPPPNESETPPEGIQNKKRFASVYHLLSLTHNHRIRIRVFLEEHHLNVPSVVSIWPAANWFEREAFDMFGIVYDGHPDLRRILTDYGFLGHPFRKDFPLIGKVEALYDAYLRRVVYDPVSIEPRVLEPKVIRDDNRYQGEV